jgi:hypothetical protein
MMDRALSWLAGIVVTGLFLGFLSVSMAVATKVTKPEFVPGQKVSIPVTLFGKTFTVEGAVASVRSSPESQTINANAKHDRLPLAETFNIRGMYYPWNCYANVPDCRWPART